MGAFGEVTALRALEPGRFAATSDPAWFQGAGAFGGVVAAWLARAMAACVGDEARALRSLACDLCAPVRAGEVEVRARVVRSGRAVSFAAAELLQAGQVAATGSAVFARAREEAAGLDRALAPPPPSVPPWERVTPWPRDPRFPVFTRFFEHRQCLGALPWSGAGQPLIGGWTRLVAPEPVDDALRLALLDAWPPAMLPVSARPIGGATVRATFDLFGGPAPDPAAYLLVLARSATTIDGYSAEDQELWTPDGRLLGQGRQLVALG